MSAPTVSPAYPADGDALFFRRMATTPLLDEATERALAERIQAGHADSEAARAQFIEANLRLVASMARRYTGRGVPLADLIQEGAIGLSRAVDGYDPSRGARFAAYATWWIRQALVAAVDTGRLVRRPAEVEAGLRRVHATDTAVTAETGRAPSTEQIAARTGLTATEVTRLRAVDHREISLDAPTGEGGSLGDLVADGTTAAGYDATDAATDLPALRGALSGPLAALPAEEARVLVLRFGLGGEEALTLDQAARALGTDRLTVRRRETQALARLRGTTRTGLHAFL